MVPRVALHLEGLVSDLLRSLWTCTSYSKKYILNVFTCLRGKIIVHNVSLCVCVCVCVYLKKITKNRFLTQTIPSKFYLQSLPLSLFWLRVYLHKHKHTQTHTHTHTHTHTCIDIPSDEESIYFSKAQYIFIKETNHNFDIGHQRKVKCEEIWNIYRFTLLYS